MPRNATKRGQILLAGKSKTVAIAPVPSRDEVVRLFASGELASELARLHKEIGAKDDPFVALCVELHNAGDIDLLSIPGQPAFAAIKGHRFFTGQHFYCNAIPLLDARAEAMMECCRLLIAQAGPDGAAGRPNDAFVVWCRNNPGKAAEVIRAAREGDELAKRFVGPALEAAGNVDQAIAFIQSYSDDRRRWAMQALGRVVRDDAAGAKAISALQPFIADGTDDSLRACALFAAIRILQRHKDADLTGTAIRAAVEPGPETLYTLAQLLWMQDAPFDAELFRAILRALESVDPAHDGTVRAIDTAIPGLLKDDTETLALDLVTALLAGGRLTIDDLEVTAAELTSSDLPRLYRLSVRWLLSGEQALCGAVSDLIGHNPRRPFETSIEGLGLTLEQQGFLCRKAVGYLFAFPAVCCSIIVSVLRGGDASIREQATELLFDPILVSYVGDAREYLESRPREDLAYDAVRDALARVDKFQSDLDAVGLIKELHPSEYQRNVVRQLEHDESKAIQKQAESRSIFLSSGAVQRANLLYGRHALTYVTGLDGSQNAVEMELKMVGTTWELPRRDILDPIGLSYMLRVFRVEKPA